MVSVGFFAMLTDKLSKFRRSALFCKMMSNHPVLRFNVRVYGFLCNPKGEVLLADEWIKGKYFTKFPGGGLDLGEGPVQGLIREFMEETGVEVQVQKHLYTTDIFLPSAFDEDSQLIAIYYHCTSDQWESIPASEQPFNFRPEAGKDAESFRWLHYSKLQEEKFLILPSDIIAADHFLQCMPIS